MVGPFHGDRERQCHCAEEERETESPRQEGTIKCGVSTLARFSKCKSPAEEMKRIEGGQGRPEV